MVMGALPQDTEVAVIGAGPGGYVAALRAADLGKEVVLIEARDRRGGVCLLEGCIPSKTLINAVEMIDQAHLAKKMGLTFGEVKVDVDGLRKWTDDVIGTLSKGIDSLLKDRGVQVVKGQARFAGPNVLQIDGPDLSGVKFKHCIIATGSRATRLPVMGDLPLWTSEEAVRLPNVPKKLLVVGGGYIGLELGLVYAGLGAEVHTVELLPSLLATADQDLVQIVKRACDKKFKSLRFETKVTAVEKGAHGYVVTIEEKGTVKKEEYEQVLFAVGRRPNTENLGLETAGIKVDRGLIVVNEEMRTSVPHIFAIGDVVPGAALAHKASREGKVAAEVIAGHPAAFDNRSIPAVVFTHPEIAWTGLTEAECRAKNMNIKVGKFPLSALGRARTLGQTDGFSKVIADAETDLILGVAVVGPHASELIAEGVVALEMGATLEDLAASIHPHPTLSESVMEAAEVAQGTGVHTAAPKKAKS